jgi:hypothetical protein
LFCKACFKPFPNRTANPPPNAAPVQCEFCNGYFCQPYWGCTAAVNKNLSKVRRGSGVVDFSLHNLSWTDAFLQLSELAIPDGVPVSSFGHNPEEQAVLRQALQKQGKTADQAFKAVLALSDAGTIKYGACCVWRMALVTHAVSQPITGRL